MPVIASQPRRRMFVLVQTAPAFEVVAIAADRVALDRMRTGMLDAPWDQDTTGERALSIHPAVDLGRAKTYVAEPTRNRASFQRGNRFR